MLWQSLGGTFAETNPRPVEQWRCRRWNAPSGPLVHIATPLETNVTTTNKSAKPPAPRGAPERELEEELKKHPRDLDKKVDVGSDESMDASDPSAAAHPGQTDDPVPSSGFPE